MDYKAPEKPEEIAEFKRLQARLPEVFERIMPDPMAERTVLVIPSLSLDDEVLARITGANFYEERMLSMLLLLRMPRTRVIYVTSQPIHEAIIDYYLHLLPGIPHRHSRQRLTLLSCHDASWQPLSRKILDRPLLLKHIEEALGDRNLTHMVCFNVTAIERSLSVRLGVPIYGCDPDLLPLGSKSGSRKLFREAGVATPEGFEDLRTPAELAKALATLKQKHPEIGKAVVKLNEGFSGEGNALFRFRDAPHDDTLEDWIQSQLPGLAFAAGDNMDWPTYARKFAEMGGVAELYVDGEDKRSPSVQARVDPLGQIELISTHDQVLGGPDHQIFIGCRFPADRAYRSEIQEAGLKTAAKLAEHGVRGRFGIDFMSVRKPDGWEHFAIEINLRKGGTTHPYLMLQFLTGGSYDPGTGAFTTPEGRARYYFATDNLESEAYKGLSPDDLVDIAVCHGIHFHGASQTGVVFHLIGALSEFGKLGMVCVGESPEGAEALYAETVAILDKECSG